MQEGVGLLDTGVMPIFMIIALDIVMTLRFSINCLAVICSPTVIFAIMREASSETYGPRVYFPYYILRSINQKYQKYFAAIFFTFVLLFVLVIFYIYLYQISSLQVTVKGLTTPFLRWVQVFDYLCRYIYWGLACTSYWIDTLVLNNWGKYLSTLLHHPFLFKGKPTQAQEVAFVRETIINR